ncbi:hypothetical protein FQN60_015203 [Xyrichtys novacula]|uniref:Uncharacterized protein n=1 Tax=Xyrichtys novacula TaxID=13765 RepID=A0AAV1G394_XYRNO|nr:hypothetical protein FQN60_015203 [Xyrichtys novacula]
MEDVSSCAASARAGDVLPPLSIKVQVVTTVWHSLSACGLAGRTPEQLGSIGCHIQPPVAVKDGRDGDECCTPVCVIKPPANHRVWASEHTIPRLPHPLQSPVSENSSPRGAEIENGDKLQRTTECEFTRSQVEGQPDHVTPSLIFIILCYDEISLAEFSVCIRNKVCKSEKKAVG